MVGGTDLKLFSKVIFSLCSELVREIDEIEVLNSAIRRLKPGSLNYRLLRLLRAQTGV